MNYEIVELNEMKIIGKQYELTNSLTQNIVLAKKYWIDFNSIIKKNRIRLGLGWSKYAFVEKREDKIVYFIAIPEDGIIFNDFEEKTVVKQKYLVVEHIGDMSKIKDTINYVFKELIPNNQFKLNLDTFNYFEKYGPQFHWNRLDSVIEIYIPIK